MARTRLSGSVATIAQYASATSGTCNHCLASGANSAVSGQKGPNSGTLAAAYRYLYAIGKHHGQVACIINPQFARPVDADDGRAVNADELVRIQPAFK